MAKPILKIKDLGKSLQLRIKLLSPEAKLPQYAHDTDAGFDVFSIEEKVLKPGERHIFKTGLSSEIPQGWYIQFFDKSSLSGKFGVIVVGGVIDAGYRGEWGVTLINLSREEYKVNMGDKIVQGIMLPITQPKVVEVEELEESARGAGGWGSTGKK